MSDIIKSVIFGDIEGITEWLPISSTGHLIIAEEFLRFKDVSAHFYSVYSVVIQLGAVLAVAAAYFKKLFPLKKEEGKVKLRKDTLNIWQSIIAGCLPAGVVGILFDDVIDAHFYTYKTVSFTLIIYGILFIIVENFKKSCAAKYELVDEIDGKTALLIGVFQMLSLIPGTSRSGATILGAILLGVGRTAAAEFSFFMAIPVMLGASAVKIYDFGFSMSAYEIAVLLVGFLVSFAVSLIVVKSLIKFVKTHSFSSFGVYRILLGAAVLIYFTFKFKS